MTGLRQGEAALPPLDRTLTRVVLLMRLLGWAWLLILVVAAYLTNTEIDTAILVGTILVATAGTGVTLLAGQRGFLGETWYVIFDAAIAVLLTASGWLAGHSEFLVGGYPVSWIFIVAYATGFMTTVVAGALASGVFAVLHVVMELDMTRTFGSIQFLIVALVVGWAFSSLRDREGLRLEAEEEKTLAEQELAEEQKRSTRLRERSMIANRLHDSVLQTLKLISSSAEDPDEVRYLTRLQERDLRLTINEYQSPYANSFRARLLEAQAIVEDRYRVEIRQVVKDDIEMDERLEAVVGAAGEAMNNAARHSGSVSIDLFSEVLDDVVVVTIRDRGDGFDPTEKGGGGISHSIVERMAGVGGTADVRSAPGRGTEVEIRAPLT